MKIEIPNSAYFVYRYTDPNDNFGFLEKNLCFVCAVQQSLACSLTDKIYVKLFSEESQEITCDHCGKNIGSTTY